MENLMLKIDNIKKEYRLGQIGGTTLRDELQRLHAKIRNAEDPTKKIGAASYNYGEKFLALDGITFDVKKGERVGIIGHNGAGKSTLLKLISRITAPTGGSISLNGRVASMLEVGTGFHPELTGRENIYMNGAILGMTKKEIDAKIESIIDFSEVRQFIDTPVKRYSSGMYVKLAFSVAAHLDSEILIMDEVLAVGDMAFQQKCLNKMRDVSNEDGRTILYVSHNMNTIKQLCDRVIVLDHGKVVFDGGVDEGISNYLGVLDDQFPNKFDLSNADRPLHWHGQKIRLTKFEFLDKNSGFFDRQETMRFKISLTSQAKLDNLRIIVVLSTINGERLGFAQSDAPFLSVLPNKEYDAFFEMNLSNLVQGKYCFILDVFNMDETGSHLSYDHPSFNIPFAVIDNDSKGIKANKRLWGSVELSDIHCFKVE